jgi:hypothetical protein
MRRLDWFLAAIVATFLIGAIAIEASALSLGSAALMRPQAISAGDVSLRRLVSHLPRSPMMPDDPR